MAKLIKNPVTELTCRICGIKQLEGAEAYYNKNPKITDKAIFVCEKCQEEVESEIALRSKH